MVIIVLIVLIVIAISVNVALAWFFNRATNSRIEIIGDVQIATQILNGQTIALEKDELYPGAVIGRSLRIQKDSEAPNFYLRIKSEIRIDGMSTSSIKMQISEQDSAYWWKENAPDGRWYYAYSDFDTLNLIDERSPIAHLECVFSENVLVGR